MTFSEWAEQVPTGGRFVKLRLTGDTPVEGTILSVEKRDRTDRQGNVVCKIGTSTPRIVWWFRLQTAERDGADDDGVRILEANESMARAIKDAERDAGVKLAEGGTLKVGVKADPPHDMAQADYIARYTPPSAPAAANDLADF